MVLLGGIVTIIYYLLVAFIVFILIRNLIRTRRWETEILYVVVLIPFLLRLLRLK
jgi:large-conductance mechanosensitive channel